MLAKSCGRDITADFENEEEYRRFCDAVTEECIHTLLKSLTLGEIIELWGAKNGNSGEIAEH